MKKDEAKQKIFDYFNEGNLNEVLNIVETIYENITVKVPSEDAMKRQMDKHGKNVYQNTSDVQTEYSARFAYKLCYDWMIENIKKLNA